MVKQVLKIVNDAHKRLQFFKRCRLAEGNGAFNALLRNFYALGVNQFFIVKDNLAFATPLKTCSCVCQEVILIGSKYKHDVVDVDLTHVVYEAV